VAFQPHAKNTHFSEPHPFIIAGHFSNACFLQTGSLPLDSVTPAGAPRKALPMPRSPPLRPLLPAAPLPPARTPPHAPMKRRCYLSFPLLTAKASLSPR